MSILHKRSTLRETLYANKLQHKAKSFKVGKLSARYLFRACVRLVIEYKDWISNDISSEFANDNVSARVKMAQTKKSSSSELSIKDRATLLIAPHKRTEDDVAHILQTIERLQAFKNYTDDMRASIGPSLIYQFVPANRVIIRQDHKSYVQYYVVTGQLQILKRDINNITGEMSEVEIGTLEPGDMFGVFSLLNNIRRTATVVSKTSVDLLLVTRSVFDLHLRDILLDELSVLHDALENFNYFKGWSEETMRECSILSKIRTFEANQILLGDGKGMLHYVYFIVSGECQLIEHMLIEKIKVGRKTKYKLRNYEEMDKNPYQQISRAVRFSTDNIATLILDNNFEDDTENAAAASPEEFIQLMIKKKNEAAITKERLSIMTVTLQDVINQWHEITDVVELLRIEPCIKSLQVNIKNVSTVFMQICLLTRKACFGLGEHMKNRRVVSLTPVKCLLIPRYWLFQHNRANIWTRIKNFLNSKYPSNKQLFAKYVENKKWAKHTREYTNEIIDRHPISNDTKMYHVPYSIRIHENIIDD